jgi:hypothetical protein
MRGQRMDIAVEAAHELSDLATAFGDLLIAGMAAHHFNEPTIQSAEFLYMRRACWEGAVISYARSFMSGQGSAGRARASLISFLDHVSPELRASHERLIHLRNKRVGHHVASDGGQTVEIFIDVRTPPPNVHIGDIFVTVENELWDEKLLADLEEITQILRAHVGGRIDELRFKLLDEIAADVPTFALALSTGDSWRPAPPSAATRGTASLP